MRGGGEGAGRAEGSGLEGVQVQGMIRKMEGR